MKAYIKYANDVINGKIVAGELIKGACKRFINDLKDERFEFREELVDKCIKFISMFKHYTGSHAGKNFELLPYQKWIVANIVGFYWSGTNERRFTQSYLQMARKSGKSFFAGALCMYFLIADKEPSAEVLLLANSRKQAIDVDYKVVHSLAKQIDPKMKLLKYFRDSIAFDKTESSLKVLSAEAKTGDGYNCSFGLIDEFHESPDSKMRDLVISSQGMRTSPHCMIITTAGFDKSKPCYQLRTVCSEIVTGLKEDDTMFAAIYELDENDDWTDENVWIKSNPSLGQTVSKKYLREQIIRAKNNPSDEVGVLTKNLNQWCSSSSTWIPEHYILNSTGNVNLEEFKGCSCYMGIDLAATSDLTAVSLLIIKDDKYYFKTYYYLPESALAEKQNKELYKAWQKMGLLTVTPGNVTDYDYVLHDILKIRNNLNITCIHYDKWNATPFIVKCTEEGLNMIPITQSQGNFNKPTKEMERLILSDKTVIDNSEITRFCFRNVVIKADQYGNIKPIKYVDKNKMDGVMSMLMALNASLDGIHYSNEIDIII